RPGAPHDIGHHESDNVVPNDKLAASTVTNYKEVSRMRVSSDPQWMIGWVDYDRGLVVDGTIRYAWGDVNTAQEYGLVAGVWVLVHQELDVPRFSASLEISYSDFRFLSHP
ncbi:MAG TPA: hypothetical protein VN812_10180, partial [Candidatus Acidoferrales bacterium]|nr:hypothetical protein [Candidatus Acidoferrales bacterium]